MRNANNSSKDERPEALAEQAKTQCAHHGSDQRESVRMAGHLHGWAPELVEMDGLLRLTVPHLSYAKEDHAERQQKSVLVACDDRGDRQRHAGENKRNGPLGMILDVLGFHPRRTPFAEIVCRFHLSEDGGFTQEVVLPPGWKIVSN